MLRDEIAAWDLERAGSWSEWAIGIERLYSHLDIIAKGRSFHPSDKLFKLRTVLMKLDGEREKAIFYQLEIMMDQSKEEAKETWNLCWAFADKRMKLIDKPSAPKQAAFSAVVTPQPRHVTTARKMDIL